jgi:hypothetical protein
VRITAAALAAALCLVLSAGPRAAATATAQRPTLCNVTTTSRIVAVGDVHGAFDKFVSILREAELIDGKHRWTGGNAILVQLGDVLDRGPDSRKALDLIRLLEPDAARAGGGVIFLLGNHEMMRMGGDYRYVSPAEYEAFKSSEAADLRDKLYDHVVADSTAKARAKGETFDAKAFRKEFLAQIPLGSVEMQLAFSEKGDYGHWLREHNVMARINDIVFVHGGPAPGSATDGCDGTNARIRTELPTVGLNDANRDSSLLWWPEGPLWFRGLVTDPPTAGASSDEDVTAVLKSLGASRIVVGHTSTGTGRIRVLHDHRVFQIDTGMLGGSFFPSGAPSALEIMGDKVTAIYEGKREVLR